MKKLKKFTCGGGAIVGFTISVAVMLLVFLYCLSLVQLNIGQNELETAGEQIVRDLVVCTSLSEAQKLAKKEADAALKNYSNISGVETDVFLNSGLEDEWIRGDYVILYIDADIDGLMISTGKQTARFTAMIERNG